MSEKTIVLEIEVPAIYTADLDTYRDILEEDFGDNESDWLLNICGEPGVCRLRVEVSGEKDGEVQEVWGLIRAAKLVDAGPNDEDHLADIGANLLRDEGSCEWCDHDRNCAKPEGAKTE